MINTNLKRIRSVALRVFVFPLIIVFLGFSVYYSIVKVGEGDRKYAIETLAKTARVTAYDIRFQTGKDAGSGYILGELDDSFSTMLKLAPPAINVSLFRPYLWEVKNPLMLLSSLESMFFLILTLTTCMVWNCFFHAIVAPVGAGLQFPEKAGWHRGR